MTDSLPARSVKPLFAVQNRETKLYSRGGIAPSMTKSPKTWLLGPFKNHLAQFIIAPYNFSQKDGEFRRRTVRPSDFPDTTMLIPKSFPYWGCDVLQCDPGTLAIVDRFDAAKWAWENSTLPFYQKAIKTKGWNVNHLIDFATAMGIDLGAKNV